MSHPPVPSRNKLLLLLGYLSSIFLTYFLLSLRAHHHGETLWRPTSLRGYPRSEEITRMGEEWFAAATGLRSFLGSNGTREFLKDGNETVVRPAGGNTARPVVCIGIDAFTRSGADYLPATMGALLMDLTQSQRDRIHLIVQFKDGEDNVLYEPILQSGIADQVTARPGRAINGTTDDSDPWIGRYDVGKGLESHSLHAVGTLDYAHLLQSCTRSTDASYVIIMEDDVVADRHWFSAFTSEVLPAIHASDSMGEPWLFTMLFWSHQFIGWENADVNWIIGTILVVYSVVFLAACCYGWARSTILRPRVEAEVSTPDGWLCIPRSPLAWKRLAIYTVIPLLLLPHLSLIFLQGRHVTFPTPPGLSHGESTNRASYCCSQAILFPRHSALEIPAAFERAGNMDERNPQPRDMALFDLVRETGRSRLVWKPALFQHIGSLSGYHGTEDVHAVRNWGFEGWV